MKGTSICPSPVGDIQLDWEDGAVTALKNADRNAKADAPNELTRLVFRQLDEYFAGTRKTFDFPYRLHGTPFSGEMSLCFQPKIAHKSILSICNGPVGTDHREKNSRYEKRAEACWPRLLLVVRCCRLALPLFYRRFLSLALSIIACFIAL